MNVVERILNGAEHCKMVDVDASRLLAPHQRSNHAAHKFAKLNADGIYCRKTENVDHYLFEIFFEGGGRKRKH